MPADNRTWSCFAQSPYDLNLTAWSVISIGDSVETTIANATELLDVMIYWKHQEGRTWKNPDHAMLWTR